MIACTLDTRVTLKQRVLVIDDDEDILYVTKRMLEREGIEVETATDGQKGLDLFYDMAFDLVITDIVMPEKDGIEVIAEIKKNAPEIKIIAISGGGHIAPQFYLKAAQMFRIDHSITKPLNPGDFLRQVKSVLTK